MPPREESRRVTDLDTLKAFGHPLRMKLYRALHISRTATASQLADQVDEAVSLVSYHLRKLADHGLIEQAGQQSADGRERWWQVASQGLTFRDADFSDSPEKAAAHAAIGRAAFEQRGDLFRSYLDSSQTWGPEWTGAAFSSEYLPALTAAELGSLAREMHDLVKKYEAAGRAAQEAGENEGREQVALHVYGFPFRH